LNKIILFLILLTVILCVDFTISYADTSESKMFGLDNYIIETIFVATNPWGITYDSVNQYMYFVNHDSRTVSVIDTSTNTIINVKNDDDTGTTISVETHPFQLAYDPANKRMYVTNYNSHTVSVIDTITNTVIGSPIPVGTHPLGIAYDPVNKRMYVSNYSDSTVSVIDTITNTVIGSPIPVENGNRYELAYDPANKRMYVTNYASHTVSVIDTITNTVIGSPIPVENGPRVIAYDSVNERMYVVNTRNSTVSVIDTITNTVIGSPIPVGTLSYGIAYDSVNERMYVTNYASHTVSVIDTSTKIKEKSEIVVKDESIPKNNGGGCLIATAAYGSEMSQQVQMLREIRDNQLINTESGLAFMSGFNEVYYSFSPYIADMEREHPMFKEIVKVGLTPMLSTLAIMQSAETESEVLGLGLSVIALNLGMYLGIPSIIVIVGMIKKF
jgi:YVTN family beta-propeller protein